MGKFPEPMKGFVIFLGLICFARVSYCEQLVLYDDEGGVFTLTTTGGCYSFNSKWAKRASAVDIDDGCFNVFDDLNCKGRKATLATGMEELKDLKLVKFDKAISSVKLCSPKEEDELWKNRKQMGSNNGSTEKPDKESKSEDRQRQRKDIKEVALEEHNKYRRKHGVPPLKGDPEMDQEAQRYADHLARSNTFQPSMIGRYGENLATSFRRDKADAMKDAVKRWYDKIKFYDFDRPGYNVDGRSTGSFTAIVWKSTTHLGVGMSWSEIEGTWIIVAYYDPPARRNRFRENVPPPTSSP